MGLGDHRMNVRRLAAEPDAAWEVLRELGGTIGERLAGTEPERRGITFLAETFASAGLEPRIDAVPVPVWTEHVVSLEAGGLTCPAISPCFGGRTPEAGVSGRLIAVGDPMSPADLADVDLTGAIALVDGRDVQVDYPDYPQTDLLLAAGAIGVVFVAGPNQEGGLPQAYYNFKRALYSPVPPSAIVSWQDGQTLAARQGHATLKVNATVAWSTSANIWAELPGSDLADEIIVVGAHHDGVRTSPAASDNAGGCAIVAELARALAAGPRPRRTICFVHFGAHEVGLFGSESWLRDRLPDIGRIAAIINFDGHGLIGGHETASLLGNAEWVRLAQGQLAATGLPLEIRYEAKGGVGVDSVNFAAVGRNAINFGNGGAPRAHTPADTLDPLGPVGLAPVLCMGETLLRAAADAEGIDLLAPPPSAVTAEVQRYCARWGWGITG
jgi:hypothetical protein